MTESREHFALDWIKREIDETLKAARQALEAYAESDRDETKMRACLTYLHQVHGTLLMLELTGVTVLTDEMEQLAQALLGGSISNVDDAQQLLMQGILQLPAFLEEIQKGFPDSRRAVLPLANELRGARGVERFPDPGARSGVVLHGVASSETLQRFDQIDGIEKARRIRAAYQQVLLSVLKGEDSKKALATLAKVAVGLERICERTPYTSLWRAFSAFVAALSDNNAELTGDVVRLLRRVDAEIKALAQHGAQALTRPLSLELVEATHRCGTRTRQRQSGHQATGRSDCTGAAGRTTGDLQARSDPYRGCRAARRTRRRKGCARSVRAWRIAFQRNADAVGSAPQADRQHVVDSRLRELARSHRRSGRSDSSRGHSRFVRRRIAARRRVRAAAGR